MKAPGKVNLCLLVGAPRIDGLHPLVSVFQPTALADDVAMAPAAPADIIGHAGRDFVVCPGIEGDNLALRALTEFRAATGWDGPPQRIAIRKRIPVAAGMGGGSADAAAVLRWAGCQDLEVAASLGADVPFCLVGGRARVTGIGEVLEPLPEEERTFTLLTPPFGVSTPAVYRAWDDLGGPTGRGSNDLELAALKVEPRLAQWRDRLARATGLTPVLAGSGSTWFVEGAFEGPDVVVTRTSRP